jgi:hypothetical protein
MTDFTGGLDGGGNDALSGRNARPGDCPRKIMDGAGRKSLWNLVFLALILRLAFVLFVVHPELRHGDFSFMGDESGYHRIAATLATERLYRFSPEDPPTAHRSPGAVLPLAMLYALWHPAPVLGVIWSVIAGILVVPILGILAKSTTDNRRVAFLAMLFGAVMPTLCYTSAYIGSDAPATTLYLLALSLLAAKGVKSPAGWALAGAVLAFCYLTRTSPMIFLVFLYALGILLLGKPTQRRGLSAALCLACFCGPVAGWGIRNHHAMGEFFTGSTVGGRTLWEANNPVTAGRALPAMQFYNGADLYQEARAGDFLGSWVPETFIPATNPDFQLGRGEMEMYHAYVQLALNFARKHPGDILRLAGYKLRRIFTAEPYAQSVSLEKGAAYQAKKALTFLERWFVLLLGVPGLFLLTHWRSPSWPHYAAFVLAGGFHVGVMYVNARFLLPITVVLIVPAAFSMNRLLERVLGAGPQATLRPAP